MDDFLVIGGGIAGLSAGARLSRHGKVTVLEAESALGYHASGRSAALFEENYGLAPVVALNRASAEYHRTANGGYLSPRGFLLVGRAEDGEAFAGDMAALGLERISCGEAMDRVPILDPGMLAEAAYHAGAEDIDTDRMLQDFAREIRRNGGRVLTGHLVEAIAHSPGWRVDAAGETFEARILVNAAGAWADQVAALSGVEPVGLTPCRRSMARLPAPGGHDVTGWPLIMGVGERWYAKPDAGKLLVSPADADPVAPQDAWADDMVLAEGLARYEEMVTEPVTRVETNWAGLRSFAPDKALVLGPDPEVPDFVWCAGQGGYGFQSAPAASQLVADLVTGAAPAIDADMVAALRPDRLRR
ncbi:Glycine/D-amino acid oxidase [Cribrihabitans marinus]|uniref:Glycine/D-amino acid oxidase n=1 Tax=Cribrihabitans marinus TaxID=1227549 RepID=A0A1H6RNH4_9RHOB|nr:FAD-dependent oxidoreductase [Cribrihabitans marinus]GGH20863.1 glycerol-3-phosphate dehydrogenase [Cribrihabitans marinus]SEI53145.1 Glycine/D-amino acid oxidase [Cribrihabitans marinus]